MEDGRRQIQVEEFDGCLHFHGMGASFDGTFARDVENLFEAGYLDEIGLERLYSITGEHFDAMIARFDGLSAFELEPTDQISGRAVQGGVRGFYTHMEGLLIIGSRGALWVAYIDDDVIRYFTTEPDWQDRLPAAVDKWRERFADKSVVFQGAVQRVAKSLF